MDRHRDRLPHVQDGVLDRFKDEQEAGLEVSNEKLTHTAKGRSAGCTCCWEEDDSVGGVAGCQVSSSAGASLACLEDSANRPWLDVAVAVGEGVGSEVGVDAVDMMVSYQQAHPLRVEYVGSSPALR